METRSKNTLKWRTCDICWWISVGVLAFGLLSFAITATLTLYWLFLQSAPMIYHSSEVITQSVRPGADFMVRGSSTKLRQCPVHAEYWIKDGDGAIFQASRGKVNDKPQPPIAGYNPIGTVTNSKWVRLPSFASPGHGKFWEIVIYRCNPLQEHRVVRPVAEFEIEKSP